ncbi:hypothetical protein [Clostridium autoethanogenum]|uniref:hypothetical protein n=1 Tax=Clostridium autoethanogenum TaxID=84023 RepID=UPI001FAA176A|nr:hypothetical protein [Clostridium autoethanogenum]
MEKFKILVHKGRKGSIGSQKSITQKDIEVSRNVRAAKYSKQQGSGYSLHTSSTGK